PEGRPYLLHTELIQEVRMTGARGDGAPAPQAPPVQLVTLASTGTPAVVTIEAWFHLPQPVRLPPAVEVTDATGTTTAHAAGAVSPDGSGFSSRCQLPSPGGSGGPAPEGQVAVRFPAAGVLVGDPATSLLQVESSMSFLDQEAGGDVLAYAEVGVAAPA